MKFIVGILLLVVSFNGLAKTCDISEHIFGNYDQIQKKDKYPKSNLSETDYFYLVYSWSPGFCDSKRDLTGRYPDGLKFQCSSSNEFGWVVHGLWAQSYDAESVAEHPRYCKGDLPLVSKEIITKYLCLSPGAPLLQGEWEKHGSCDFATAGAYFKKMSVLDSKLMLPKIPMSFRTLYKWMRKNNPSLSRLRMDRIGRELVICYDKDFDPINCPY